MSGLFLLLIAAVWLVIALLISVFVAKRVTKTAWQLLVGLVLFMVLLPLPLMDEIIGKYQFEKLCRENSTIQVNRKTAVGRTVYLENLPTEKIQGTSVTIWLQPWRYVDATTGEVVVSFNVLNAKGGMFSMGESPLTFNGNCIPGGDLSYSFSLFKELNITKINHPKMESKNDNN